MFNIDIEKDAAEFQKPFTVIAPGWQKATVVKHEFNDKTPASLFLTLQVGDNEHRECLNINHDGVAGKIARGAIAKLALSAGLTGQLTLDTLLKLYGRPFEAKFEIKKFESNKEPGKMLDGNEIKDYRPVQAKQKADTTASTTGSAW